MYNFTTTFPSLSKLHSAVLNILPECSIVSGDDMDG